MSIFYKGVGDPVKKKSSAERWGEIQNEIAGRKSKEAARLELIRDDMHKVQNGFLWNLPGMVSPLSLEDAIISKALPRIAKVLKGITKNAYKINPAAEKEAVQYLYRAEPYGERPRGVVDIVHELDDQGKDINFWLNNKYNRVYPYKDVPKKNWNKLDKKISKELVQNEYVGKWMETDPERLSYYIEDNLPDITKKGGVNIFRIKAKTKDVLGKYDLKNNAASDIISLSPDTEKIVSRNIIERGERFDSIDHEKLIKEGAEIVPHWWKGYPAATRRRGGIIY